MKYKGIFPQTAVYNRWLDRFIADGPLPVALIHDSFAFDTRNHRVNVQAIEVDRWPVSSLFGFYVGGQTGTTISNAVSVLF